MKATLFLSNSCHNCHYALEWLCDNEIDVEVKNVSEDKIARKELMSMAIMSVPYLIYGTEKVLGFNVKDYERIFK